MGDYEMRLFHYTIGVLLKKIIEDGQIKLATTGIPPHVKAAVWCTTKPSWEQTCNKAIRLEDGTVRDLNEKETHERCGGLFRIEIDPKAAPYKWKDYKNLSGDHPKILRALEKIGSALARPVSSTSFSLDNDERISP